MKQILLFSLICLISSFNLFAQQKIALQIEASPNYSFRTFKNTSDLNISTDDENKIGYSLSLKSSFSIIENFHLISGLEYNNKGFKTTMIYFDEQDNEIQTIGTLDLIFLDVPLYLGYQFKFDKFYLSPVIGISYGRLIGLKSRYDNEKTSATKDEIKNSGFNRDVLNLHGGFELGYQISDKIGFKMEPKVDYTNTDLNKGKDNLIKENLYIIGVNIGMIIKI